MSKKGFFVYFLIFLGLILFVFRSMIFKMSSSLYSWLDFPYVVWLIYQGIGKISNLSFGNFGATNAFYPVNDSYFFSDLFLPQSVLALPFSVLINNPILVINIIFVLTFVLNYISLYLFWSVCFKKNWQCFLASIVFIFSPYLQLQFGHFQMLSYWPLFFSLYFFIKEKQYSFWNSIIAGLFLIIQFLSSVYLSVFLIFSLCLKCIVDIFCIRKFQRIKSILIVFLVFFIGAGWFIYNYSLAKKHYGFVRDYGEYVTYSAHITDYIFNSNINSMVSNFALEKKWNSFNKHVWGEMAAFPGWSVLLAFLFSLIVVLKKKGNVVLGINVNNINLFFLCLVVFGFVFSIGPRINFNGVYSGIPTPYTFLIKYVPFFDSIRGLARWSFLFYLGLTYFFVSFLQNKKLLMIMVFLLIFFCESLPVNLIAGSEIYVDPKDDVLLKTNCDKNIEVLLEIPTDHMRVEGGVVKGLNYISKRQLATLYHGCLLVNGYSGFEPPEQTKYYNDVGDALSGGKVKVLITLLESRQVSFLRITSNLVSIELKEKYMNTINGMIKSGKLIKMSDSLYKVSY